MNLANEQINIDDFHTVTQTDFESDMDKILELVKTASPIRIITDDCRDLLIFDYEDYKRRYISVLGDKYFKEIESQAAKMKED